MSIARPIAYKLEFRGLTPSGDNYFANTLFVLYPHEHMGMV